MNVVVGHTWKGEAFLVGHAPSREAAEAWIATHAAGLEDEYRWLEVQTCWALES